MAFKSVRIPICTKSKLAFSNLAFYVNFKSLKTVVQLKSKLR